MKRFFSHIGKTCRRSRNVSRGAVTAKVRQEEAVGGTVISVHRFQQGARDVLVDDGSRRTYVFIPSATPIRNIRKGETVRFRTVRSADNAYALSVVWSRITTEGGSPVTILPDPADSGQTGPPATGGHSMRRPPAGASFFHTTTYPISI